MQKTKVLSSSLLLVIIYLAFISLGLPDSTLGVAWPFMRISLKQALESLGLITTVITLGSVLSSFSAGWILKKLGTGPVILISGLLTGGALLGFSIVPAYGWLLVLAVPLGFGGGSVDTGLNHYVSEHYSSRHMNWLHACWGIGATLGPLLLTGAISGGAGWQSGYQFIAAIQLSLAFLFLLTLGLWSKQKARISSETETASDGASQGKIKTNKKSAQFIAAASYLFYSAVEAGTGLWAASILTEARNFDATLAGIFVSVYYGSITGGRILTGFVADRLGNRFMVRWGLILSFIGVVILSIPLGPLGAFLGLLLLGFGLAPVFPCLMHETPRRFDEITSRRVIGFQVGAAYLGVATLPAFLGLLGASFGLNIILPIVALFVVLILVLTERLNKFA